MRTMLCALAVLVVASSGSAAAGDTLKHSHRYTVVLELRAGIRGTPLQGHAFEIERAGFETGISPFFMVGASGTESSVFRAACSGNRWNGWGLSSCGPGWYVPTFRSALEAFRFFGRFVRRQWPAARTPYDLAGYCGCGSAAWGSRTVAWIRQLFGNVPTGVRYV